MQMGDYIVISDVGQRRKLYVWVIYYVLKASLCYYEVSCAVIMQFLMKFQEFMSI